MSEGTTGHGAVSAVIGTNASVLAGKIYESVVPVRTRERIDEGARDRWFDE